MQRRSATAILTHAGFTHLGESELVRRCRSGDPDAWERLYANHFGFVSRVARRLGTPACEIEDVCQEVFVVAFRKLTCFKGGRLTTWLYRIAANVVSDRRRKARLPERAFSPRKEPMPLVQSPEQHLEGREAVSMVGEVLQRMSAKKRDVLILYEIEGLSGAQIAQSVGCSVQTVWTRLHYARQDFERFLHRWQLRRCLSNLDHEVGNE